MLRWSFHEFPSHLQLGVVSGRRMLCIDPLSSTSPFCVNRVISGAKSETVRQYLTALHLSISHGCKLTAS